jgi:hypothetical protein
MDRKLGRLAAGSALIAAVLAAGCTSARVSKSLASGEIGCPPDAIVIENETATATGLHNFEAICKGKRFICQYQETTGINCTEAL